MSNPTDKPVFVMPTWNFVDTDITTEMIDKATVSTGKFFQPGNYDLVVHSVTGYSQSKSDPTWYTFEVILTRGEADDERTIKHFQLVPSVSPMFNKEGGKNPLFLFAKFREFCNAFGISVDPKNMKKVIPATFGNPKALVGKSVNVDIGYDGYHIVRLGEGEFVINERNGKEFKPEGASLGTYPDRDSAIADALSYNITIKSFAGITKFHAAESADESEAYDD